MYAFDASLGEMRAFLLAKVANKNKNKNKKNEEKTLLNPKNPQKSK